MLYYWLQYPVQAFLANASLAFYVEDAISGYKETLAAKEKEISELHRQLGKRTVELEWASKKLKNLDYNNRSRATDNIAIERFWRSAKHENIYLNERKSIKDLKAGNEQ